jgi:hypothetical protein
VSQLVPIGSPVLQALVAGGGGRASMRFLEFFAASIRDAQSGTYADMEGRHHRDPTKVIRLARQGKALHRSLGR